MNSVSELRSKYRRSSTMKFPAEKTGFLRRAREKCATICRKSSTQSAEDNNIPILKVHLTFNSIIAQPLGDNEI
jgi:hypothetical protein